MRNNIQKSLLDKLSVTGHQPFQIPATLSKHQMSRKLPFRYSKIVYGLSMCLCVQTYLPTVAIAAETSTHTASSTATNKTIVSTDTLGANADKRKVVSEIKKSVANDQNQNKDEIEDAIVALKLKKAVEQGLVDSSVLEEYQQETLNNQTSKTKTSNKQVLNTTQINDDVEQNEKANVVQSDDSDLGDDAANHSLATQLSTTTSNKTITVAQPSDVASDFDRLFTNRVVNNDSSHINDKLATQDVMHSPQQLDRYFSGIELDTAENFDAPIARLDAVEAPIGFDSNLDKETQFAPNNRQTLGLADAGQDQTEAKNDTIHSTNGSLTGNTEINPDNYLPNYQVDASNSINEEILLQTQQQEETKKSEAQPGFFKGLYNRLFNDGYAGLPKIKADIYYYLDEEISAATYGKLQKADTTAQPYANIKAAMENISVESISDFTAVTPKLYEEAINAAQAVGYYDTQLRFKKVADDKIAVVIDNVGEPVKVTSRIIDIRGEGQDLEQFQTIMNSAPPEVGSVFNHGVYEKAKHDIESTKEEYGFFDGQWLNRSVDVILPDNTADVDLIYDTGERYRFDEVVFFTIDPETGQLTTDPDKLPVKPELLHQLHEFKAGDKFYAPLVTKFTNDLSATQFFNSINVEAIKPNSGGIGQLVFEEDFETEIPEDKLTLDSSDEQSMLADTEVSSEDFDQELKPIEYSINQETYDKVQQIIAKAERLSRLPDDRVLDETEAETKTLLGKISSAISNAVASILPDEEDPLATTDLLSNDVSQTILTNRKTPQQVTETKSVPLYVFVTADKPRDVDLGIGYGTDTGVRTVARLEHNLVNRKGYQAGVRVASSDVNKSIEVHGSRPWKHPLNDTLSANLSYEQETIDQGEGNLDLNTNTIKAGLARNIRNEDGWNRTYSLKYRNDQLESGVTGTERENLPIPFNREGAKFEQEALLFGYQMDKTSADSVINPTKGWRQYYSLEAGADNILTDTNMVIARAGVNGVYSFGEMNKHQIIASFDGGYIWADEFDDVPYKLRFFAGGDRSIRGYDYNSLSALDKGYLVGGQVLAVANTEYNYEFKPGLRGAVFADVGNAYDKDLETETKLGVGVGVRWASPVGMVRLDLAAGVLEDSIPIRLHFFIGSPLQ